MHATSLKTLVTSWSRARIFKTIVAFNMALVGSMGLYAERAGEIDVDVEYDGGSLSTQDQVAATSCLF